MMKGCQLIILLIFTYGSSLISQDCNKLGVWLWHLEQTGFVDHSHLAVNLANLGVKRVYVKVADGRMDSLRWTELTDTVLINSYKDEGLEVWAWSYNYTENDSLQAAALYHAARTGYDGYVVDVETEFDGNPLALFNLFFAFDQAKQRAINEGHAIDTFNLYCTTWGNPRAHNYSISVMNPYVTGYMPQTYLEEWMINLEDPETRIAIVDEEYLELGGTKPVHHILSTARQLITPENINKFIAASGEETSLWRVPGGGIPFEVWEDWQEVDWEMDFCGDVAAQETLAESEHPMLYPNPTSGLIRINEASSYALYAVYSSLGQLVKKASNSKEIEMYDLPPGAYYIELRGKGIMAKVPVLKI